MRSVVVLMAVVACGGGGGVGGIVLPDAGPPPLPACDGQLDPAFGTGGVLVADDHVPFMEPLAAVTQPDDKLVVVGTTDDPPSRFVAVRYLPDGTLDPAFSDDGVAVPALGNDTGASARAVTIEPDGKLLVAGTVDGKAALARLTADGVLDTSFAGGYVSLGAGTPIGIAVNAAGIVVAADGGSTRAILYRVDLAGAPDPSFGTNGVAADTLDAPTGGPGETVSAFFLDSQGRHLLVSAPNDAGGATVVRETADGARDATFGNAGAAWPPLPLRAVGGIAANASGTVLVAMSDPTEVFGILDHGAFDSGAADSTWPLPRLSAGITAQSMVMDSEGAVTVTGDTSSYLVAGHVTPSGQFDRCWVSAVPVGTGRAAAIDSQGRVTIIAAAPFDATRTRLALARLQ